MSFADTFLIVWSVLSALGWLAIALIFLWASFHLDDDIEEIFPEEAADRGTGATAGDVDAETT